jgi:aldehyde dehydrogenase (NAD+)
MGTSVWEQGPAWVAENFDSVNPATSEVIGTYPVQGRSEVDAIVERAGQAASWWAGLTYRQRRTRLLAWKSHITRYLARLAELVHTETGKPLADAQLCWRSCTSTGRQNAGGSGSRRVRSGLIAINGASRLEYQPFGVVGGSGPGTTRSSPRWGPSSTRSPRVTRWCSTE